MLTAHNSFLAEFSYQSCAHWEGITSSKLRHLTPETVLTFSDGCRQGTKVSTPDSVREGWKEPCQHRPSHGGTENYFFNYIAFQLLSGHARFPLHSCGMFVRGFTSKSPAAKIFPQKGRKGKIKKIHIYT